MLELKIIKSPGIGVYSSACFNSTCMLIGSLWTIAARMAVFTIPDDSGIFAQLTVGEKSAFHSYSFSKGSSRLAVDFLTCGLIYKNYDKNEICEATVRQRGSDCIEACLWTDFPLYVCLRFEEGGKGETKLLLDGKECDLHKGVALEDAYLHTMQLIYTGQAGEKKLVVQVAFSLKSAEQAYRNLLNGKKFEDVSREASGLWRNRPSAGRTAAWECGSR